MGKLKWNQRFFYWLSEQVFNHPSGTLLPWYLFALRWVLCPLDMLRWRLNNSIAFSYDASRDVFTLYGINYTGHLFRSLSVGLNVGQWIRIVSRGDRMFTLGTVSPDIQKEFDAILIKREGL